MEKIKCIKKAEKIIKFSLLHYSFQQLSTPGPPSSIRRRGPHLQANSSKMHVNIKKQESC